MLVKFFKTAGKSPTGMTDYLLGKDRDREMSRVIKGDPELVDQVALNSDFKNTHTSGCLSFEEKDIPLKNKLEIMGKFEETILPGLNSEQYAITWIEHKDKGRLELNFHIANVELSTGKRLQPYYDRIHQPKINDFKAIINHDYGLSSPDDPSKKQVVKENQALIKRGVKDLKSEINEVVTQAVEQGIIKNRDDVKALLIASELDIIRETDKSISIKNPTNEKGRNIRLSGGIYEKEFYEVDRRSQKQHAESIRGTGEEIESIRKRLDSRKEREAEQNKQKYQLGNNSINRSRDINSDIDSGRLVYDEPLKNSVQRVKTSRGVVANRGVTSGGTGWENVHLQRNEEAKYTNAKPRNEDKKLNRGGINELYARAREYFRGITERSRGLKRGVKERESFERENEDCNRQIQRAERRINDSKRHIEKADQTIEQNSPRKELRKDKGISLGGF